MTVSRWGKALRSAAEGTGFAVPGTVGSVGLLYFKIGPEYVAAALVAALLGVALLQFSTARNPRPMMWAVRVLEVTTLASFLDQFVLKMPGWNLADTPEHRLLLVMAVCVGAALVLPFFYLFRLQRFARLMPAPVFVGFSCAVGLTLLWSQTLLLWHSLPLDGPWAVVVAVSVLAAALASRRWLPAMPSGVVGLLTGTGVSLLLAGLGVHVLATVTSGQTSLVLPVTLVSAAVLAAPSVATMAILQDVLIGSVTIATIVFLNTVVSQEMVSQTDDAPPDGLAAGLRMCAAQLGAALLGSPPLTPSFAGSRAAVAAGGLGPRAMAMACLFVVIVAVSNVLHLVALAAIAGLLLFDAVAAFDLPSLRQLRDWLRGKVPDAAQREDLATVAAVMVAVALFNMVAGIFVGIFAGLLLYALRNGKRLVRTVSDGTTARSHCQRSRVEMQLLELRATDIRYIELEGALFFGAVVGLQKQLRGHAAPGRHMVIDWAHVIGADSTVATAFVKLVHEVQSQGCFVAVSGLDAAGPGVSEPLARAGLDARQVFQDADRALEWAETQVIAQYDSEAADESTLMIDALALLHGIEGDERDAIEAVFTQKLYRRGETVFQAGDVSGDLLVVQQGSVDILVPRAGGDLRLARVRRGAMVGELSFLDASPRSASAVASEDLLVSVLSREQFDQFAVEWPAAAQRMLLNLALDLSGRLRRTNRITVGRSRQGDDQVTAPAPLN